MLYSIPEYLPPGSILISITIDLFHLLFDSDEISPILEDNIN